MGVFQLMHSHRAKYWCIPNKVSNGAHSLVMGDISSHRLSLNNKGCWGTTDDCVTSFLHFSLLSTALWDLANSRPVHSLMLSSHLFLCLLCLLPPFTMPCKMVLARPDEWETCPYHCSLRLFTVVRWSGGQYVQLALSSKEEHKPWK